MAIGVKYIKIAKFDTGSVNSDLTTPLGELNTIRINYSDNDVVEYPVVNTTEFTDYYLYSIVTTNATSSADNTKLNYYFSASGEEPSYSPPESNQDKNLILGNVNFDNLNYYDNSTGEYSYGDTPNTTITASISCSLLKDAGTVDGQFFFALKLYKKGSGNTVLVTSAVSNTEEGGVDNYSASIEDLYITPIKGETYYVAINSAYQDSGNPEFEIVTQWNFTTGSSYTPQAGSQTPVIIEPFFESQFRNTGCDVLINNGVNSRKNSFLFDVDYSNSQITALNKEVILSGSATKARIPDSNFTTKAIINSRYIGKELQASRSNVWTEGDISFGKTVTVGNPQTYFAYFNWVGGTSPEWGNHLEDRTAANIKYYIDEAGDVIDPINDSEGINLGITRQNFEENKNAIIALDSDDEFGVNLGALNAEWPIFKSGYTISPILYTQIAEYDNNGDVTGFTSTGSIDFVQGDLSPVPAIYDYQLTTFANSGQSFSGGDSNQTINFQTPLILGESASFSGNTTYLPDTNPSASGVVLTTTAKIRAFALVGVTATYAIQDNSGNTLAQTQINHAQNTGGTIIFTDNNATTSTRYKLVMVNSSLNDNKDTVTEVFISTTTELKVQQNPLPGTGNCTLFWTVNAGNRNAISASSAAGGLNQFYGQKQKNISRSGFNPITLPFELQVGDEIRFEGTEELAFKIKDIDTSSGTLNLTLDRDIPANTDTDFFLIRRYIDDPSYVILEVDKPAGPSSGGILKPQYLSSRIESNLDTILENLQDKGLI